MHDLTHEYISENVADSSVIFQRGTHLFNHGAFLCTENMPEEGRFVYGVDGNYGDYTIEIIMEEERVETNCDCPYPSDGCKHVVAALLDIMGRQKRVEKNLSGGESLPEDSCEKEEWLSPEEIRRQALEDRMKRAGREEFRLIEGEMYKGVHLVTTLRGRQYEVTLHDPAAAAGHCTCPDFLTNRLNTCKHLIFAGDELKAKRGFRGKVQQERFPFVDIFWDSVHGRPRLFKERSFEEIGDIWAELCASFGDDGLFKHEDITEIAPLLAALEGDKRVRIEETVFARLDDLLHENQMEKLSATSRIDFSSVNAKLYPYQKEGVGFGVFKRGVLIGDEMGLGKTIQAIALTLLKREIFGFRKVLVVTVASLKEQWKREIEKFTNEDAVVVAGPAKDRMTVYREDESLFKITNYEAVLRDVTILSRYKPDLVILDEAQRIKNFTTKTAEAVKGIPRKHSVVLTGTPLENKLEDVYSIVQFLDADLLSPLWEFAANHFMLSKSKKGKIIGYRNLDLLHEKLKPLVIRRKKEEVLEDLPDEVVNNYYIDLTEEQEEMHAGYGKALAPLLGKKYLTPMDLRKIQKLLLRMRQVCDSTFLIDRATHISPKLEELQKIVDELVVQNNRKVVIFSEWTTMTYLIGRKLSDAGIPFVELSGKVPVAKRQVLIDEFTTNPHCKVFLSTDAGGTGLNLQAADCVINFELPWNPAKMNQRIGRVNRIGQKSRCVNVVNLIAKRSIEERIVAGIKLKTDLFKGVFDGGADMVTFSSEKRTELLNQLRELWGGEPEDMTGDPQLSEELPVDTPHYLNPELLGENGEPALFEQENESFESREAGETVEGVEDRESGTSAEFPEVSGPLNDPENAETHSSPGSPGGWESADVVAADEGREPLGAPCARGKEESTTLFEGQSREKVENVLNSGMEFIGGLLEMATGKKLEKAESGEKMIRIDGNTGEVTMKFKLPGF